MSLLTDLVPEVLHPDGGLLTGAASLVYAGTVTGATIAALFSRDPGRRRAARYVLALLLRRTGGGGSDTPES
ncbi:hypothetical protein ACWT_3492 [Actinoplanes sp. SE50]|uniref:hypothetical protein n=1 Tax=unclassified Actinoplanes TaxID=2626549 RepID=UPI00023EBBA2|nr:MULTISPECIES: hypothetical protein [unclassified Actinoplanes]AEV84515.1 hypothetical protein ACPL_3620 [Actinoplanes sp. SE50/110]ATO82907.1 hypothetical protein ACWT_3492 [Actinoplanes sp. SE50]SLM00315.1 hypothetical protein ACSP50_3547 [Actinoplanes sp. SE50/110]